MTILSIIGSIFIIIYLLTILMFMIGYTKQYLNGKVNNEGTFILLLLFSPLFAIIYLMLAPFGVIALTNSAEFGTKDKDEPEVWIYGDERK